MNVSNLEQTKIVRTSLDHLPVEHLGIDHLGIATSSLESGSAPYIALGLPQVGLDEEISSQNVIVRAFQSGPSLIELLAPTASDSPIASFLEKRGSGLHHVAFRVANLESEIARLQKLNAIFLNPEPRVGRAGSRVVFLHPKWGAGTLIELVEHPELVEDPVSFGGTV
jgi:methylmalonyl-CoA/ethylmalonyl-CoA epimerase